MMAWSRQTYVTQWLATIELGQALIAHEIDLVRSRIVASKAVRVLIA